MKVKQQFIRKRGKSRPGWKQNSIKGIVVHYTANPGATAANHFTYFDLGRNSYASSAHYFIDKKETIQIIPDDEVAFHVNELRDPSKLKLSWMKGSIRHNTGVYYGNGNVCTIGIELCIEKDGSFHDKTIEQAQQLIKNLMTKYNIPLNRVVRHYDQTGKRCPLPFVTSSTAWQNFKNGINKSNSSPNTLPNFSLEANSSYAFKVGEKVKIKPTASKYATGQPISNYAKNKSSHTIRQLNNNSALLSEINSWVKLSDLLALKEKIGGVESVKVGSKVKIKATASKYATGQTISNYAKNRSNHTVEQIKGNTALLSEIKSWVNISDLTVTR